MYIFPFPSSLLLLSQLGWPRRVASLRDLTPPTS